MFERYTEFARRVIFFARYEASRFGSPWIETEHLLLGLLREDKLLRDQVGDVEGIRRAIETASEKRTSISTSVDLPLNDECKRALGYAAEEADALDSEAIRPGHLVLGLLRVEQSRGAQLLNQHGLELE